MAAEIRRLDLALIGCGHVGRRFLGLLQELESRMLEERALACSVIGIATARHGTAFRASGLDTARAVDLLAKRGSIQPLHDTASGPPPESGLDLIAALHRHGSPSPVVVELTPLDVARGEPAVAHLRAAFAAGAHVVTANKGPVAHAYRELRDAAQAAGVCFLFEGAVMDGIPVFNLVRETLPAVRILGFRGVVNSTTNHLLTAMEAGREFGAALAEMQAQGIAEDDPSLDIDGWDAAAKTAALANVLLNGDLRPQDVARTGIAGLSQTAPRDALARSRRLKLVASAEGRDDAIRAQVAPMELQLSDPLAALTGMANMLILRTDLLGEVAIGELEGGLTQTAYAIIADLVAIGGSPQLPAAPARRTL